MAHTNIDDYVAALRDELGTVADAGGPDARALADRLTAAISAATRLVLLEALTAAADEITRELAPGSVEVRLRGRDPEFVVTLPGGALADADDEPDDGERGLPPVSVSDEDDGATARLNLRLPESLKLRVEEAARRESLSLNAWLVRAAAAAAEPERIGRRGERRSARGGQNFTGWVS